MKELFNLGVIDKSILINSIRDINNKLNISNYKVEEFFEFKNKFDYQYKIIKYRDILENKKNGNIKSPIHYLFFNDIYIIIYPFGLNGKSEYLSLGIVFSSKIKIPNYMIYISFELTNKDFSITLSKKFQINSYNKEFVIKSFYKSSKLEEEGFIDNNGDLTIKYIIEFDKTNTFLKDINDYYELIENKINKNYPSIKINDDDLIEINQNELKKKKKNKTFNLLGRKKNFPKSNTDFSDSEW